MHFSGAPDNKNIWERERGEGGGLAVMSRLQLLQLGVWAAVIDLRLQLQQQLSVAPAHSRQWQCKEGGEIRSHE